VSYSNVPNVLLCTFGLVAGTSWNTHSKACERQYEMDDRTLFSALLH
jgi:hypothetical protein